MFKKAGILFATILICSITAVQGQQKQMSLSLDDCIVGAMKNNLNVAVEILNPEIADTRVWQASEKFIPALNFSYNKRETNTASYSFIDAADQVRTFYNEYNLSLYQAIPTGGAFNLSLNSYQNDTNRRFQTINPRFGSTLTFSFSQPLLKNFGFRISRREIIVAKYNRDIAENQFHSILLGTIFSVEQAYWNLVYSIEDLKVKKQSLKLAQDLLEDNQKRLDVGSIAPIDIYTAQAEVATREADILQAEALVKNSEDLLTTVINLPDSEGAGIEAVVPTDRPVYEKREISLEEALVTAMHNRPDLKALMIDIKSRELDVSYAKNQLLPELNLVASYWSPGISGNQIIYQDNNAFSGIIIGTIPGGASDALRDAFGFKYNNWSVGLTLSLPLETLFSRAEFARAKARREQALLRLKDQEKQIFLEIKTAVRAVQTDFKRIQAYAAARELAGKKMEAEVEKFKVGKSTNYLVLQYQRDEANARSTELKAIIDYNMSLANLDRALGVTLESKNIKLADFVPD